MAEGLHEASGVAGEGSRFLYGDRRDMDLSIGCTPKYGHLMGIMRTKLNGFGVYKSRQRYDI